MVVVAVPAGRVVAPRVVVARVDKDGAVDAAAAAVTVVEGPPPRSAVWVPTITAGALVRLLLCVCVTRNVVRRSGTADQLLKCLCSLLLCRVRCWASQACVRMQEKK